ncbi:hypothetical protein [Microbacterium sp. USHLN272]|uniref:hypothetical protein n=1 Tax=Microbacterium sp. USHLN272 TaxID=3081287 RepID=UPI00301ADE2A
MKRTLIKASAAAALVAGALFITPTLATANTYTPPATGVVSSSTVEAGGTVLFSVPGGVFEAGEAVTISITGESALGASLGFVKFAIETKSLGTVTANAAGGVDPSRITLPSNASGRYTILATSPSNPTGVVAYITISGAAADEDDNLATTGLDNAALLPLWIGGGALVLAGGGLAVAATVRRNKKHELV